MTIARFRAYFGLYFAFWIVLLALILTGCTGLPPAATTAAATADALGVTPPAPAEATTLDEKALTIAAKAVTAAARSASALVRVGIIPPGSPTALALARRLDDARDAIGAAADARAALSATSYREALARAEAAVDAIQAIISPFGG